MKHVRTLHCGTSIENYKCCIDNQVAGFTHRGPESGDIIYLLIKIGKTSYCGAKFILDTITDEKPWNDADKYVLCFKIKEIKFAKLFDVSFLKEDGGEYWPLKYLQASKLFDEKASLHIEKEFQKNLSQVKTIPSDNDSDQTNGTTEDDTEENKISEVEIEKIEKQVPDAKLKIMGTFQTVQFLNETNPFRGLEQLVTANFFNLFTQYDRNNSLLISQNRIFKTHQMKEQISGVSGIPDAILITFDKTKSSCPIKIFIIEYECYGEGKVRSSEKSKYLNSHIIPQLMQFASTFSVITDQQTRDNTLNDWIGKISQEICDTDSDADKVDKWMHELDPKIQTRQIISFFERKLKAAFKENVHVFLIIDELSAEQKETIGNIISSFILPSENPIKFDCSIVKLIQKISVLNSELEYALTVQ